MGSAENGGRWHPAPEGRQNGPPLDIYDTIPNTVLRLEIRRKVVAVKLWKEALGI